MTRLNKQTGGGRAVMLEIELGELEMYYNCDDNIIFIKSMLFWVEGAIQMRLRMIILLNRTLIDTYFTGG